MSQIDYSQPDFYHFNEDSIRFSEFVVSNFSNLGVRSLFDICCGCGVIGLEIARKIEGMERLDFLDLQKEFLPFLEKNISQMIPDIETSVYISDFRSFENSKDYDLIVANPPYFKKGAGRLSPDKNKQNCRTFMEGDIHHFCNSLLYYKTKDNEILFVYPKGLEKKISYIHQVEQIHSDVCIYTITT